MSAPLPRSSQGPYAARARRNMEKLSALTSSPARFFTRAGSDQALEAHPIRPPTHSGTLSEALNGAATPWPNPPSYSTRRDRPYPFPPETP